MNQPARVDILLATFNGEKYLAEQLESIARQTYTSWRLLIRDDGSSDRTIEIIHRFAERYDSKVALVDNQNIRKGAAGNFSRLIELSTADYVMLADQDDVWLPEKVQMSFDRIRTLEGRCVSAVPVLVYTDLTIADSALNVVKNSLWAYQQMDPARTRKLNRLLIQNTALGCTMIFNSALRKLAVPISPQARMHDWWLILVAAAFGQIDYIPAATVLYRQHSHNTRGATSWSLPAVLRMTATSFRRTWLDKKMILNDTQRQAQAFLLRYRDQLAPLDSQLIESYATLGQLGFTARRCTIMKHGFLMNGIVKNVGLMLLI